MPNDGERHLAEALADEGRAKAWQKEHGRRVGGYRRGQPRHHNPRSAFTLTVDE
jgi:hypothetical protein